MLEELREQAFLETNFDDENGEENLPEKPHFLGMTPVQRFTIALLLFAIVALGAVLVLLVTGRVVPPFLA